jgi:soluble lytic murein transglycosylase-like protein
MPHACLAAKLYVYQDQHGSTLLTDKKRSSRQYTQVKVRNYPDSNVHRYRNWGASEDAVLPSFSKAKNAYDSMIRSAASRHGVSEGLIKAIMHTESGFNAAAQSPVGAQGLMQLMPATAQRFNVNNAFDPSQNIQAGAQYLSWLLKRFKGDIRLALAAYNAGENNVSKYGGIPPFRETQDYVQRVLSRYQNLYAEGIGSASAIDKTKTLSDESTRDLGQTKPNSGHHAQREIISINGVFTDRVIPQ